MNKLQGALGSLFFALALVLIVAFQSWKFEASSFGDLLHAGKPQSLQQFLYFFVHKDPEAFQRNPENSYSIEAVEAKTSFFASRYRPLNYLLLSFENHLFDYQEFYYFLLAVFLHMLVSLIIFALFRKLFSLPIAFLGACFFAGNQAVGSWLGSISHQQYQLEILMFFVISFLLKKHLETGKLRYLLLSLSSFFVALLFRETLIVFPLWALGFVSFYNSKKFDYFKPVLTFISYSLFCVLYLVFRSAHYPLSFEYYYSKLSVSELLAGRVNDLRLFFDDLLGTVLLPGDRTTKAGILLLLMLWLGWLFTRSAHKDRIFLFFASGALFMWPLLFRHYDSRYLYLPLLFFVAGSLFLIENIDGTFFRRVAFSLGLCLCAVNMTFFISRMNQRQGEARQFNSMIDSLFQEPLSQQKMVCFLQMPQEQFDNGTMQALCLKTLKTGISIFQPSLDASHTLDKKALLTLLEQEEKSKDVVFYAWDDAHKTIAFLENNDSFPVQ